MTGMIQDGWPLVRAAYGLTVFVFVSYAAFALYQSRSAP